LTGFFGRCDRLRDLLDEMQSAVRICSTERTLGQVQRVGFLMDCHFIGRRTPSPTGHFLGRSFSLSVSATFLSGFLYRTQSIAKPSFLPAFTFAHRALYAAEIFFRAAAESVRFPSIGTTLF